MSASDRRRAEAPGAPSTEGVNRPRQPDASPRIGVAGVSGRMGRLLVEEITAAGAVLAGGTARGDDPAALFAASEVVIDFTHAHAAPIHAAAAVAAGAPLVLGSSGLSDAEEDAVRQAAQHVAIVYAANFSPGVNLMLALAERIATSLPGSDYDAEIVEMHHRQKVDAPSGTAVALGRAVAAGRGEALRMESGRDGHTGPRGTGTVGFAALRGGQVVGEHTLLFAAASEHIALTHRSFDRRVYATGAVRAALWVIGKPPGLYGMRDVLGM